MYQLKLINFNTGTTLILPLKNLINSRQAVALLHSNCDLEDLADQLPIIAKTMTDLEPKLFEYTFGGVFIKLSELQYFDDMIDIETLEEYGL